MLALVAAASALGALWFDPLPRYNFPPERIGAPSALLCYVPGLDGTNGSPFAQWPPLAEVGFAIRVQDVRTGRAAASFDATVDEVADFLRASSSSSSPTLLMGESYGAVVAAAVALREPSLVDGLILVNPASAFSQRPELQVDAARLRAVPEPFFPAASFALLGRKTFDVGFLATAVKDILIDRKLEQLRASDPALAGFYDAALAEMMEQVSQLPPRDFMVSRLAHLEDGCAQLEDGATGWPTLQPPLLVVAGTADKLLQSDVEAARLQALLGTQRCAVHLVKGAGHAGTLDQRCDLASVLRRWTVDAGLAREASPSAQEPQGPILWKGTESDVSARPDGGS